MATAAASSSLLPPHPWGLNRSTVIRLRKIVNLFKGTIGLLLAIGFVLYDQTNTAVQARTWSNVALAVLVQTPAQPIGAFLDSAFLGSMGLGLAGGCWALMNTIARDSYPIMGVLLFIMVYFFSLFRALSQRYFGFGLIGPLLTYTSVASVVGVVGANTANGDPFDQAYLRDTLYSFLIGFGISTVLTVVVWPEFAEHSLRIQIIKITEITKKLVEESVNAFTMKANHANRSALLKALKESVAAALKSMTVVDAEIFFSKFSATDYHKILRSLNTITNHLSALDSAIVGREVTIFQSELFKTRVAEKFKSEFELVEKETSNLLYTVSCGLVNLSKVPGNESLTKYDMAQVEQARQKIDVAFTHIDASQQDWLIDLVVHGDQSEQIITTDDKLAKGTVARETLIQVTYFIHAFHEIIEKLSDMAISTNDPSRRTGLHYNALSWIFAKPKPKAKAHTPFRHHIVSAARDWYRRWYLQSTFLTFLVAIAPSVGQTMITFVINLIGAIIGNSLGFFALEAFGTGIDKIDKSCHGWWSLCNGGTIQAEWGLFLISIFIIIPFIYVMLFSKIQVLGLLSLLSFTTTIIGAYGNRNNPRFDSPWNRYYKLLAGSAMAISFALFFSLMVYPNLARQTLKQKVSTVLRRLSALYNDTLVSAFAPFAENDNAETRVKHLEDIQIAITEQFNSLRELVLFASVEFRVEGKFQRQSYNGIIDVMGSILDRLTTASTCLLHDHKVDSKPHNEKKALDSKAKRNGPFDPAARKIISQELLVGRRDLQNTIRLLLFLYSTSMTASQPLPQVLPGATRARNRVFHEMWTIMQSLAHGRQIKTFDGKQRLSVGGEDTKVFDAFRSSSPHDNRTSVDYSQTMSKENAKELMSSDSWLRFYSFALTMSMLAVDVDSLAPFMKHLFGELPAFVHQDYLLEDDSADQPLLSPIKGLVKSDTIGRRGHEDDIHVYGIEDRDDIELLEGIPMENSDTLGGGEDIELQIVVTEEEKE
ncbi:hypothetical protein HDU97_007577 [Phlyctochytrium planicorne]|nr:hypothetical protein HDU97_007577 [Phlyctochytrium planicorne]